jgi:hypothetical protein
MRFRIRRDIANSLHLEEQRTDENQRQYWYNHGIFDSVPEAEEYADGIKAARDQQATYEADVAAGRDILSTFDL